MTVFRFRRAAAKTALFAGAFAVLGLGSGNIALADCQEDVTKLTARRQAAINVLNQQAKSTKGKLDPIAACPKLRNLAAVENQLLSYMVKNKEWCNVPDDAITNLKAGAGKTASVAGQACGIAAKIAKMKQQQAAQAANGGGGNPFAPPAQKLPTGPL